MGYLIKSNVIDALEEDMQDTMMCYEGTQEEDIVRFCYKCMQRVIADLPQYWPNNVFEDTGLTLEQILELKERDTAKAPKICKNKHSDAYTCPNCALALINKDETGWFCGKHYKFCPDCGQRIKWEE